MKKIVKQSTPVTLATLLVLAGFGWAVGARAQPAEPHRRRTVIPFQLTGSNTMTIRAVLNGRDSVTLLWHTAASDITLTEDGARSLQTVQWTGTADSVKSWGGGSNASEYSRHNTLTIAGLQRTEVTVWKDQQSGEGTAGKIGLSFFAGSVVEMDFDRDRIVIEQKLPKKVRKYTRLPLVAKGDLLFLPAGIVLGGDTLRHDYLLHSGYGGDLLLDDAFVTATGIGNQLAVIGEKTLKDAFGHAIVTKKVLVPIFSLGGHALTDVPAGFFQNATGLQKMSVLGCDLLKRWNWIIDADRRFIYLRPSRRLREEYPSK